MKIALGLPLSNVSAILLLDWARLAESGPFSSLCAIDRLVYPNYDPLIVLTTVASVTQRLRLMTTILLAPLHPPGVLAKQVASLDALSNGRLTLGLGVGAREDDYRAAPANFHDRGKRFERQLERMSQIWSGQPLAGESGRIGPAPMQPGGPKIVLGGSSTIALQRLARWGAGFIAGAWSIERTNQYFRQVEQIWQQAGRSGTPHLIGASYYGLGPDAAKHVASFMQDYYACTSDAIIAERIRSVPTTSDEIEALIQQFAAIGTDELVFWPCIADLSQVILLGEIAKRRVI